MKDFFQKRKHVIEVTTLSLLALVSVGFLGHSQFAKAGKGGGGPVVSIITPSFGATVSGASSPLEAIIIGGTATDLTFDINGTSTPAISGDGGTTWTSTIDTTQIADGEYSLTALATVSGNPVSGFVSVTVDNVLVEVSAPANSATVSGTVVLTGTVDPAASAGKFIIDGNLLAPISATSSNNTTWNALWDTTGVSEGNHTIEFQATVNDIENLSNQNIVAVANSPSPVSIYQPESGATITGMGVFSAIVSGDPATSVGIIVLKDSNPLIEFPATYVTSTGRWYVVTPLGAAPVGAYELKAHAVVSGDDYYSALLPITIDNSSLVGVELTPQLITPSGGVTFTGGEQLEATVTPDPYRVAFAFCMTPELASHPDENGCQAITAEYDLLTQSWKANFYSGPGGLIDGTYYLAVTTRIVPNDPNYVTAPIMVTVHRNPTTFTVNPFYPTVSTYPDTDPIPVSFEVSPTPDTLTLGLHPMSTTFEPGSLIALIDVTFNPETERWEGSIDPSDLTDGDYVLVVDATKEGVEDYSHSLGYFAINQSFLTYKQPPKSTNLINVSIDSPTSGATVSGTQAIYVSASPKPESVLYQIYPASGFGESISLTSSFVDGLWKANWDTRKVSPGSYVISAQAVSSEGPAHYAPNNVTVNVVATPDNVTDGTTTISETEDVDGDATNYNPSIEKTKTSSIDVNLNLSTVSGPLVCPAGSLIKLEDDHNEVTTFDTAVYYCAQDGKRYAFPNLRIFKSWFDDFSQLIIVTSKTMSSIPLGGNVSYRPGTRMIKIQTDPRVYAVSKGGILRWISTETIAKRLYGTNWNQFIDDVSDAFFTNYKVGTPITE
jgi:hypothetical protein